MIHLYNRPLSSVADGLSHSGGGPRAQHGPTSPIFPGSPNETLLRATGHWLRLGIFLGFHRIFLGSSWIYLGFAMGFAMETGRSTGEAITRMDILVCRKPTPPGAPNGGLPICGARDPRSASRSVGFHRPDKRFVVVNHLQFGIQH